MKCLGCIGATPFSVWVVFGAIGGVMEFVAATDAGNGRVFRVARLFELAGIVTSTMGIHYLKRRIKNQQMIPRNICCCCCLCCCNCPFLGWSLIVASGLDILSILLWFTFALNNEAGEAEAFDFVFVCLAFMACLIDGAFGGYWLKLIKDQDKDVCCGPNAPPTAVAKPVQGNAGITVVGQPIGVEFAPGPEGQKPAQGAPFEQKA